MLDFLFVDIRKLFKKKEKDIFSESYFLKRLRESNRKSRKTATIITCGTPWWDVDVFGDMIKAMNNIPPQPTEWQKIQETLVDKIAEKETSTLNWCSVGPNAKQRNKEIQDAFAKQHKLERSDDKMAGDGDKTGMSEITVGDMVTCVSSGMTDMTLGKEYKIISIEDDKKNGFLWYNVITNNGTKNGWERKSFKLVTSGTEKKEIQVGDIVESQYDGTGISKGSKYKVIEINKNEIEILCDDNIRRDFYCGIFVLSAEKKEEPIHLWWIFYETFSHTLATIKHCDKEAVMSKLGTDKCDCGSSLQSYIGKTYNYNGFYIGTLDEVKEVKEAKEVEEIRVVYENGTAKYFDKSGESGNKDVEPITKPSTEIEVGDLVKTTGRWSNEVALFVIKEGKNKGFVVFERYARQYISDGQLKHDTCHHDSGFTLVAKASEIEGRDIEEVLREYNGEQKEKKIYEGVDFGFGEKQKPKYESATANLLYGNK
jgi:hypothetical protein